MSLKLCKDHFSPKINILYLVKMVFFKVYNFPGVYIFQPILIFFTNSKNLLWSYIFP